MLVQLIDFEDCVYFKYGFDNTKFGLILCMSVFSKARIIVSRMWR